MSPNIDVEVTKSIRILVPTRVKTKEIEHPDQVMMSSLVWKIYLIRIYCIKIPQERVESFSQIVKRSETFAFILKCEIIS